MTYSFGNMKVHKLEQEGLLTTKKQGRTVYVYLTPKGQEVAVLLNKVRDILG